MKIKIIANYGSLHYDTFVGKILEGNKSEDGTVYTHCEDHYGYITDILWSHGEFEVTEEEGGVDSES